MTNKTRALALIAAVSLALGFAATACSATDAGHDTAGNIQTTPRKIDKIAQDGENVAAGADQYVVALKGSRVYADRKSYVVASDGAFVEASSGSVVTANSGARVDAYEGATVYAHAGSHIVAAPGARVIADPGATVEDEID